MTHEPLGDIIRRLACEAIAAAIQLHAGPERERLLGQADGYTTAANLLGERVDAEIRAGRGLVAAFAFGETSRRLRT